MFKLYGLPKDFFMCLAISTSQLFTKSNEGLIADKSLLFSLESTSEFKQMP